MYAIASKLDQEHSRQVRALWEELEKRFGVEPPFAEPIPHVSYHVATEYSQDGLREQLIDIGREACPMTIRTCGLGVITGPRGQFVTIPVIRDAPLSRLHTRLWKLVSPLSVEPSPVYAPELWFPHITLLRIEPDKCALSDVMAELEGRSFRWEIGIDEMVIINSHGPRHEIDFQCAFEGQRPNT